MENKWIISGSDMENIGTLDDQEEGGEQEKNNDESEQKREEESIDMFEGEKSKVRREGGGRGRLVRQVATFEPEEIRSPSCCHPPPDLSQVIFFFCQVISFATR